MTRYFRRTVFAFVLGAALAAAVLVGRSAFATTDTINACFKPSNGTLYLLGSGRSDCQPGDIPISWNTSGVNGQDGVSVTSEALAAGDANCANGGSKFTAVNGTTYACNGTNGTNGANGTNGTNGTDGQDGVSVTSQALAPGDDPACPNGGTKFLAASGATYACNGADGQDGQSFDGTFTSPNGLYRLVVNDTSAQLVGPNARVQITGNGVAVEGPQGALNLLTGASSLQSQAGLALTAASALTMNAGTGFGVSSGGALTMSAASGLTMTSSNALGINAANALTLHAQGLFSASGATTSIGGTPILLNGNSCGLFRPGDFAPAVGPGGGPILLNPAGSPSIRFAC